MRPSGPRHFSILSSPLSLSLISSLSTAAFLSSYFLLAFLLLSVGRVLLLPSSLRSDSAPLCGQGYRHTLPLVTYFHGPTALSALFLSAHTNSSVPSPTLAALKPRGMPRQSRASVGLMQMQERRRGHGRPMGSCSTWPAIALRLMNNACDRITFYHPIVAARE